MTSQKYLLSLCGAALCAVLLSGIAWALPTEVVVSPPNGARFWAGQRFDLRVEGKGTGPYSATIAIDGAALPFSSGTQNSATTDGITTAGYGGFNLRGYSNLTKGMHTITATFTDASGKVTVTSQFEIVEYLPAKRNPFSPLSKQPEIAQPIKNIIIMLGDGLGIGQRTAARIIRHGVTAGRPNGYLAMDQFPGTGWVSTHSLNSIVTDSAPGMSGYVTGSHQNNNQEGVFPARVTNAFFAPRVEYLSEFLHRTQGKTTGIVSTADIEDATPAANAIHTLNRGAGTGICDQYLDESDQANTMRYGSGLRVLLGGGRRWFLPAGQFGSSRADATDYPALPADLVAAWNLPTPGANDASRDLVKDFQSAGFTYVDSSASLKTAGAADKLLGLFGYGNMNVALDKIAKRRGALLPGSTSYVVDDYRAPDQPMLDEMTDAALKTLSKNSAGFVLMVEGAHIDKQSHAMDAERALGDTLEFDRAVEVARNFADAAGNTLVLVMADHECSGFSLIGSLQGGVNALKSAASDSATLDPAATPLRQAAVGVYDAAGFPQYKILADGYPETFDVDGKLLIGFGGSSDRYETWLTKSTPVLAAEGFAADLRAELVGKGFANLPTERAERQMGFFLRGQAPGKSLAVHTAADIPISAYSSGGKAYQLFYGTQENTDVFFKLVRAALGAY